MMILRTCNYDTKMIPYFFLLILCVVLDQATKQAAKYYLTQDSYIELIPNFIHLTYQENKGVSLSFLSDLSE